MKQTDLKNKAVAELQEMLKNERLKLGRARFEMANKKLKDSSQLGKAKREIARIFTAINQAK